MAEEGRETLLRKMVGTEAMSLSCLIPLIKVSADIGKPVASAVIVVLLSTEKRFVSGIR